MMKAKVRKLADNAAALRSYEVVESFEAGLSLEGWEVKSIRAGRVQLRESYIRIKKGEAFWVNAHISPSIQTCSHTVPLPYRERKLLLKGRQLIQLAHHWKTAGLALIPKQLYLKGAWVKLEFCLGRGRKHADKRAAESERSWKLEKARLLKRNKQTSDRH